MTIKITPHLLEVYPTDLTIGVSIVGVESVVHSLTATDREGQQLFAANDIQTNTASFSLKRVLRARFPIFVEVIDKEGKQYQSPALFPAPTDEIYQKSDNIVPLPRHAIETQYDPIIKRLTIQANKEDYDRIQSLTQTKALLSDHSILQRQLYFSLLLATCFALTSIIINIIAPNSGEQVLVIIATLILFLFSVWILRRMRKVDRQLAVLAESHAARAKSSESASKQLIKMGVNPTNISKSQCRCGNCGGQHD